MAIPDLLVSRHTSGGGGVFTLTGGITLSQIGITFTASNEGVDVTQAFGDASVVEFAGSRYVWHRNEIREENTGGAGNWGVVNTVPNQNSFNGFPNRSGLYILERNGTNILVGLYADGNNRVSVIRSTDGMSWTSIQVMTFADGNRRRGRAFVFRNKLYWYHARTTTAGLTRYDPQTDSATFIRFEDLASNSGNLDFCVFDNNIFAIGSADISQNIELRLWRLRGNQFDRVFTFSSDNGVNGEQGNAVLFTDNTNLYAILNGRDASNVIGNTAWRINTPSATPSVVDITDPVIPAQFRPGGGSTTDNNRWHAYMNNTVPSALEIFLWRIPGPTGTHEAFQWQGEGSTMTSLGVSDVNLTEAIFLPNTKLGGGERISASGKIYGKLEQQTELDSSGEITLSYRVFGSGANQTLTLYFTNNEQVATTQATLTGATGGSSSLSGNTIINVTPDNGSTLYTLTWDAGGDGVGANDNPKLMIDLN